MEKILDDQCHQLHNHVTRKVGIAINCFSDVPSDDRAIFFWRAGINATRIEEIKSICYCLETFFDIYFEQMQRTCCQAITKHEKSSKGEQKVIFIEKLVL